MGNDKKLQLGPFILSVATLLTSIFGALTSVPINVIIVVIFRKVRHVASRLTKGWFRKVKRRHARELETKTSKSHVYAHVLGTEKRHFSCSALCVQGTKGPGVSGRDNDPNI